MISARLEDVIVQKAPPAPVYSEHSFVTLRVPFRAGEAASAPSERARAIKPATSPRAKRV